ncbi:MAG: hypothetical protein WKG07_24125 [Hymenobacter sp.]
MLGFLKNHPAAYDLLVLDPPAFAKHMGARPRRPHGLQAPERRRHRAPGAGRAAVHLQLLASG